MQVEPPTSVRPPLPPPPPVARGAGEARTVLLERVRWLDCMWISTELLGAGTRRRRQHELEQQQKAARRAVERSALLALVELPDGDLEWLLSMGWDPEAHT